MSQYQRQSVQLEQQFLQRQQILESSIIAEKIDIMKNSIAEISTISKGKMRINLQKLEEESRAHCQQVQGEQQRLRKQARVIEDELLLIEKEAIIRSAGLQNLYAPILNQIKKIQEDIIDRKNIVEDKYSEFRDRITTIKIRMAEIEIIIRQKARIFEHNSRLKLTLVQAKLQDSKQVENINLFAKQMERIKALRKALDQQSRKQHKQQLKISKLVKQFKSYVENTLKEQQRKQKQGFQQSYNTLQDLFILLSSQYNTK